MTKRLKHSDRTGPRLISESHPDRPAVLLQVRSQPENDGAQSLSWLHTVIAIRAARARHGRSAVGRANHPWSVVGQADERDAFFMTADGSPDRIGRPLSAQHSHCRRGERCCSGRAERSPWILLSRPSSFMISKSRRPALGRHAPGTRRACPAQLAACGPAGRFARCGFLCAEVFPDEEVPARARLVLEDAFGDQ